MTLAHPAVVLPLRRLGLPMSAMVIGAMVPDIPLFTGWKVYGFTHSWTGIVTLDVAMTLVVLAGWNWFLRDALVDLSPDIVRDRLPARRRISRTAWLLAPLAALIGSASHVGWDLFTHSGRWGVRHVAWLEQQHGPLTGDQWAQNVSSVVGTWVVLGSLVLYLRAQPESKVPRRPRTLPVWTVPAALLFAGVAALGYGIEHFVGLGQFAYDVVVMGITGGTVFLGFIAVIWRAARMGSTA